MLKTARLLVVTLALALTPALRAQELTTSLSTTLNNLTAGWNTAVDNDIEKTWSKGVGNGKLSAGIEARAGIWDNSTKKGGYADLVGTVGLFGLEFEAAGVHAVSYNTKTVGKTSLEVIVATQKVWFKEYSEKQSLVDWSKKLSKSASYNFCIGVVPITCKVEAGCQVDVDLTLNLSLTGAGLSGKACASVYGSASAGLGFSMDGCEASITLRATLSFFRITLNLGLIVNTLGGAGGAASLVSDPVNLTLEVVATVRVGPYVLFEEELEIVDLSYAKVEWNLLSF